jgi:hypothetical protein
MRLAATVLALLALTAVLALPGCGGGDESPAPGGNQPTTTEKGVYGY